MVIPIGHHGFTKFHVNQYLARDLTKNQKPDGVVRGEVSMLHPYAYLSKNS